MNTELMNEIERVGSRLEKERLLAKETDTRFLRWALDPIVTFGVTADTSAQVERWLDPGSRRPCPGSLEWWDALDVVLGLLSRRELTGNAALSDVDGIMSCAPDEMAVLWACRVINKDLRCGVQLTTANKVFPGLIKPFGVMLAQEYDPDRHDLVGSFVCQPKLDGLRMVVIQGQAFTRNGRTIDTVGHVLAELSQFDDFVFDGEIMGSDAFDADSGRTRRKGTGPDESLRYHVFDVVPLDQWKRKRTVALCEREVLLARLLHDAGLKHVTIVPTFQIPNGATVRELTDTFRDKFVAQGYEGCMIKNVMSPYVFKRSDALLKFKPFHDADGCVVEFQEGKGRHKGRLGALFVEFDGVITRVGSGFDDKQRDEIWARRDEYLGKTVEAKYQGKTPDGKLRFPVFTRWRQDKD